MCRAKRLLELTRNIGFSPVRIPRPVTSYMLLLLANRTVARRVCPFIIKRIRSSVHVRKVSDLLETLESAKDREEDRKGYFTWPLTMLAANCVITASIVYALAHPLGVRSSIQIAPPSITKPFSILGEITRIKGGANGKLSGNTIWRSM